MTRLTYSRVCANGDQLDELVGRVGAVLRAPAAHRPRPGVVGAGGQRHFAAELLVERADVERAEPDVHLGVVELIGEERIARPAATRALVGGIICSRPRASA